MNPEARRCYQASKQGTFLGCFRQGTNRTKLERVHSRSAAEILEFEQRYQEQKEVSTFHLDLWIRDIRS